MRTASRDYRTPPDRAVPAFFPPEVATHAVKIACERPDDSGRSLSLWDCVEIARELIREGIVLKISCETVRRILSSHRLKPWRRHMWLSPKTPRDEAFAAAVRRICDLYTRPLAPDERVISADEHTSIQPRPRAAKTRPCRPDQPTQVEHEYKRCGALNLLAGMDTRTGQIWKEIAPRKRQVEFIALLSKIDADTPATVARIYIILDNVRMHTGKQVRAWLEQHHRFELVHPPVHCSWMNQIEQWFGILVRKRFRIADFADKAHLTERLEAFIREWNERAHAFCWTAESFEKVLAKCERAVENDA